MGRIEDILQATDLEGRKIRDAAEEVYDKAKRDAPEELERRMVELVISDFMTRLSSLQHSRRIRDRRVARRRRFESGENVGVLDLLVRLYVVEDGTRKRLGQLSATERRYVLATMELDIQTRQAEREFLAECDRRAGDRTIDEALDAEEVEEIYVASISA